MTAQTQITPTPPKPLTTLDRFKAFIRSETIMERFTEMLDDRRARSYVNSVVLAVASNDKLLECTHASIVTSALRAASLHLSVDPIIAQAYLVPYGGVCTLVVSYKGLRDKAINTNKYRYLHASPVYEGERVEIDRFTGAAELLGSKLSNTIIGWQATFILYNGFRKTIYMDREEIHAHAKQYSKGYENPKGLWKTSPAKMEKKTVLRLLILHWGELDPYDAAIIRNLDEDPEQDLGVIEAAFEPDPPQPQTEDEIIGSMGYETNGNGKPQPAPKDLNKPTSWPKTWIEKLILEGLADNKFEAAGMLAKSENIMPDHTLEVADIVVWGKAYRSKKDETGDSEQAAAYADANLRAVFDGAQLPA